MALCQTQSRKSIPPFYWEAQHWAQHSQCASAMLSGGKGSSPWPAGSALSNAAQEAICLLCHEVTLLGSQLACYPPGPRGPSQQIWSSSGQPPIPLGTWGRCSTCARLISLRNSWGPCQHNSSACWASVTLDGSRTLQCISHSSQCCIPSRLAEGTLPHHPDDLWSIGPSPEP